MKITHDLYSQQKIYETLLKIYDTLLGTTFSRVPEAPLSPTPVEATRTMRIALLSWESLHSIAVGGVAVHVTELAAALDRRGHEIHVFTRQGQSQPGYDFIDGVHYHRCPFALST